MTELDASVKQDITEGWSQKYKSSINCSHPKGFSQKAHCAGKKKHTESVETEMTCPDCGMCKTHGSLNEIKKGAKDSNGVTKCWPGKHAEGTKKGKNGKPVRNCVPNESVAEAANAAQQAAIAIAKKKKKTMDEAAKHGLYYNVNKRKAAGTSRPASSPKAPTAQAWKDAAKTAKKEGVAEGRRDYNDLRDTGFGRPERDMSDESNLLYIYKDDRIMQKMVSNRNEREARDQGYRDTVEQALKMHGIVKSKFKPGKWVQKQGDSWVTVYPFGRTDDVAESATAGATSAANVGVGAIYKNKPVSQPKNKNGTAKNALDMKGANLLGGGSIKR